MSALRPAHRSMLAAAGFCVAFAGTPAADADILDWLDLSLDATWSTRFQWEDGVVPGPEDIARFPGHGSGWLCRVDIDSLVLGVQMLDPSGTVRVQGGRTLAIIDDPADVDGQFALVAGTLELASGSALVIDDSVNAGGQLDNDGLVLGWGTTSITAPLFRNDGILRIEGRPGLSASMTIDADVVNHGLIELDSTGNGWGLMVSAEGTVSNAPDGTVAFGNGGSFLTRYWRRDLDSFGLVHVRSDATAQFDVAGASLRFAGGQLTIDPGGVLANAGAANTVHFEDVSVLNHGNVHISGASATTRFTAATMTGVPPRITGGTIEFTPGAMVDGVLHVDGSVQLLGDVPLDTTLELRGIPGVNSSMVTADPTIHGTLDLLSTGNGYALLQDADVVTVAETGAIRTIAGGSQPARYLRSDIDSDGLVQVGGGTSTLFDQAGTTLRTSGDLLVEVGGELRAPSNQQLVIDGGSVTVDGALVWTSGSVIWNDGSISGEPWELASSHLTLADGVAGPAEFRTSGSSQLGGDVPAEVRVRIEGRPGINSTTALTGDTTVQGFLDLDSTGNGFAILGETGGEPRTLAIGAGGQLTLSAGGSQPVRYLRSHVVNDGTITLESTVAGSFDVPSRTLLNRGTMMIQADSQLLGTNATTLRLEAGTIVNEGVLRWQGNAASRVELAGGSMTGEPLLVMGSTIAFDTGSTATGTIVASGSGTVEGDVPVTIDLVIEGFPGINSTYSVAAGSVLAGDLTLVSNANGWSRLGGPPSADDAAVNVGTITARPGGSQPARYLSLRLRNEGVLGTLAGTETFIEGELANAGLLVAGGPIRRTSGGPIDFVNEPAGTLAGVGPIGSAASLILSAGITSPGEDAPAQMDIVGDWEQTETGRLRIEIGGPVPGEDHDTLVIGDEALLDGLLDLCLVDGYAPSVGTSFVVLEAAGGIVGTFDLLNCPELWSIAYSPTQVVVTVTSSSAPGDVNCDGLVDFADLLQVLTSFGPCDQCIEDLDGDGSVAFGDVLVVLANWT